MVFLLIQMLRLSIDLLCYTWMKTLWCIKVPHRLGLFYQRPNLCRWPNKIKWIQL